MAMFRLLGGRVVMSRPSRMIWPLVGFSRPATHRRQVVFPQPEGPTRVTNSSSPMSRLIPSTATSVPWTVSNSFLRSLISIFPMQVPYPFGV